MSHSVPSSNGVTKANNLPPQHTPFIGHEKDISAVIGLLNRPANRLVTLTGPGGTGKTRLATQVGSELSDGEILSPEVAFSDGIFFVNLAPVTDPGLVTVTIAQTLNVTESGDQALLERLKEHLYGKKMLLILDNFEQLLEAATLVSDLISAAPHIKVLVTSRTLLNLRGEKQFAVPAMQLPDRKHLPQVEALSQYEAVALFIQRAVDVKPDFVVTNENAPAVAEICHRLDGLPLAIELAAARSKMLTPHAILVRLESRLRLLTGGARDLPARQQTLRNTIEWSYDLLDSSEQTLFRRMSVFSGGRTLEAIEEICNYNGDLGTDVLDGVESLLSKSLLQQREDAGQEVRFWMLETIHEYTREKLEESGEADAIWQRHAEYFRDLVIRADLDGPEDAVWVKRLHADHDNILAALRWARESGKLEIGLSMLGELWKFWLTISYFSEGQKHLVNFIQQADRLEKENAEANHVMPPSWTAAVARCLLAAGILSWRLKDFTTARRYYDRSLLLSQGLDDRESVATALGGLGFVEMDEGNVERALSLTEEGLAIRREIGDKMGIAQSLHNLGEMARLQGDYISARQYYEEAISAFEELGSSYTGHPLANLGYVEHHEGNNERAKALFRKALTQFVGLGSVDDVGWVLTGLAGVAQEQRQANRAARLFGAADALLSISGIPLDTVDQIEYDRDLAEAKAQLDEGAWQSAWAEGYAMSLEQAIAYAQDDGASDEKNISPQRIVPAPNSRPTRSQIYPAGLTKREVQVLCLLTQGLTYEEIGEQLVISPRTVDTHLTNVYNKLGVDSRHQAALIATEHKLCE